MYNEEINIIERGREIEVKREEVKREISRAIIVVIIAVMSLNLFACKPKTNNVTSANQIKVDVNSPEVQATLGKVRNYEAEKLLPSGTAEREKQVWTKRNHKWAEPPEEDKIYPKETNNEVWFSAYVYNGKEYWVQSANKNKDSRAIFNKTNNDLNDIKETDRVTVIDGKENAPISQILAEVTISENISKNMRGNADTINITK